MHRIDATTNMTENEAHPHYNKLQFHTDDQLQRPNNAPGLKYPSGYVEPNPIQTENKTVTRCFPSRPPGSTFNAKGIKKKPIVYSTSNGTGIVKVGNLQAVIPSNQTPNDLDDLRIVPSPTHESYVDIVKQAE